MGLTCPVGLTTSFYQPGRQGCWVLPEQQPAARKEELRSDLHKSYLFRVCFSQIYVFGGLENESPRFRNDQTQGKLGTKWLCHVLQSSGNKVT